MDICVSKAILHTQGMFDDMKNDKDYPLWKEISEIMDGEIALLYPSGNADDYVFLGLVDDDKNKELFYKKEQDGAIGIYVDDREGFDKVWDAGEYDPDGTMYIEKEFVEIID